jgi:hypothetical protein
MLNTLILTVIRVFFCVSAPRARFSLLLPAVLIGHVIGCRFVYAVFLDEVI